jgi:hypothetical protein
MDEFAGSFMMCQCDVVPRMWIVAKNYIELGNSSASCALFLE